MTGRPRGDLSDRHPAHTFARWARVSAEAGRQTPAFGGTHEAPQALTCAGTAGVEDGAFKNTTALNH